MVKVLVRGAGDLASGVGYAFAKAGFQVLMTEIPAPTVIRRTVAFAEAVYEGQIEIEGVQGILVTRDTYQESIDYGKIGIVVDPEASIRKAYQPDILVDGILAKTNVGGTDILDAPIVLALGPGFEAGRDCHRVIETKRGHYLGRVIESGSAIENTGIPGIVEGRGLERVLYSPEAGKVRHFRKIGDVVEEGELLAEVGDAGVTAPFRGVLRGLIREGLEVPARMKIGDVDPRLDPEYCFTISEKAKAIGRGALEAALALGVEKGLFEVRYAER